MKKQRNLLLASAVAAVLLPQAYAYAQGGALEEIIVTAERRATTENTTAISMNVLSADDLAIHDDSLTFERHIALFEWTWPTNRAGKFECVLVVRNLAKVG